MRWWRWGRGESGSEKSRWGIGKVHLIGREKLFTELKNSLVLKSCCDFKFVSCKNGQETWTLGLLRESSQNNNNLFILIVAPSFFFPKWGHMSPNYRYFLFYKHFCEGGIIKYRKNCHLQKKMTIFSIKQRTWRKLQVTFCQICSYR